MTVRIQFQLRDEVARHLQWQAADRGISRQAHVQDLIEECEDRMENGVTPVADGRAERLAQGLTRERPATPYTRQSQERPA